MSMRVHRDVNVHVGPGTVHQLHRSQPGLTISCDECSMRCTAACADCVVSFVLTATDEPAPPPGHQQLELEPDEARVIELLGAAGLVPRLQYARHVRT